MSLDRHNWLQDVDDVIRSRHYTWIPEGLGGESPEVAMIWLLTDILHVCNRANVNFENVMKSAIQQFRQEEIEAGREIRDELPVRDSSE